MVGLREVDPEDKVRLREDSLGQLLKEAIKRHNLRGKLFYIRVWTLNQLAIGPYKLIKYCQVFFFFISIYGYFLT